MQQRKLFSHFMAMFLVMPLCVSAHTTEVALANITDPADFAVSLYGTVLASQFEKNSTTQYIKIANTYFDKDLNNHFNSVLQKDEATTGELGCLDFIPFTNAQDLSRGFFVDNAQVKGETAIVGVHVSAGDINALKQSVLFLHLTKTAAGWRVQDIDYGKGKTTLANHLHACLKK